ncbi:precorrin-6A synthase (deacetylating) [Streptomyces sp. NPDC020983]|uniref:precorrin-6A synthase (deacetylating) n=1 Tax=Streptomyces sp. NPDC020983 TaxID=3365106 RepID=UPI0037B292FC
MRHVHVIGIGAGDPAQLTLQAVDAIGRTDVFFLIDKGDAKADLTALRELILRRHATRPHRVVTARDPERDRTAATPGYAPAVDDWRARRAALYRRMITEELPDGGTGAFLVWGDPALYDSTPTILDELRADGGPAFEWSVVPGVSSVAALTARHRVTLNQVGGAVHITTGRRLAEHGLPPGADDVVVMLDARHAFTALAGRGLHIYWGAYLGTPDEILLSGPLDTALAARITAVRTEARARKGWIMDTYLLRRPRGAAPGPLDAPRPGEDREAT